MRGFGLFFALRLLPAAAGRLLAALRLLRFLRFLRLFGLCLLGFRPDGTAAAIAASLSLFLGGRWLRRGCDHHRYRPLVNRLLLFLLRLRHIVQHLRKRFALLRPSARNGGKLVGLEQMQGIVRVVVQLDLDGLAQEIDLHGGAVAVLRFDESALLRNLLQQFLVRFLLIAQAAHQAAAAAGYLGGVKRKRLHLRHFRGHRLKIVQKLAAAVRAAADADATDHLRLVPDADLAQFDAVAEDARKILYQLAEVDPPVGREEEHRLVPLKIALHVHQLHIQPVLGDLLLAYLEGFLLALLIYLGHAQIVRRGDSHHRAKRLHDRGLHDRVIPAGAVGDLQALGGLDYDLVPGLDIQLAGIEEVAFPAVFKLYTYNINQLFFLCSMPSAVTPLPAIQKYALRPY